MSEAEVYRQQFRAMSDFLQAQLEGFPEEELFKRPGPHLNPVGWNYWHLLRIWDLDLNWLVKGQSPEEDAWHRGGFTEKSGYNPDGKGSNKRGIGFGYTDAEVDEMNISLDALREYHQQLLAETEEFLDGASEDEFRRAFPFPLRPGQDTTVAERLQHAIGHSYSHAGELRYAKGVLGYHDPTYPGTGES